MHKHQEGFSSIKFIFWLVIGGGLAWIGFNVFPVYNAYWKAQDAFEHIARSMASDSEMDIRRDLKRQFSQKYIDRKDLPDEFYKNLKIQADGHRVKISSHYRVPVWFLGEPTSVDPNKEYQPSDVKGFDRIRLKASKVFEFNPSAKTP